MKDTCSLEKPGWQLSDLSVSLGQLVGIFSLTARIGEDLPLLPERKTLEDNHKYGGNISAPYQYVASLDARPVVAQVFSLPLVSLLFSKIELEDGIVLGIC